MFDEVGPACDYRRISDEDRMISDGYWMDTGWILDGYWILDKMTFTGLVL